MKPQRDTMIKFHDAKRRIEFAKLKKDIGEDQFEGDNAEPYSKDSMTSNSSEKRRIK